MLLTLSPQARSLTAPHRRLRSFWKMQSTPEPKTLPLRSAPVGPSSSGVTDDGCGISADDLPLSVLRHATSKISDASDLAEIMTLGFRGEALAAIAAVTRMRIVSKTADSPFGSQLTVNCGEIVDLIETGCPDGTTVICEDLFSNVPARRKFLKKDTTETAAVTGVVEKIALGCPWVSIKYVTDGEIKFHTPGNSDMLGVIYVIYGRDISAESSIFPVRKTESKSRGIFPSRISSAPTEICRISS